MGKVVLIRGFGIGLLNAGSSFQGPYTSIDEGTRRGFSDGRLWRCGTTPGSMNHAAPGAFEGSAAANRTLLRGHGFDPGRPESVATGTDPAYEFLICGIHNTLEPRLLPRGS